MTETETIQEATETCAFIRKLQAEEAAIKESLKDKRSEIESAQDHLVSLFEDDPDDDRPLLAGQLGDDSPVTISAGGEQVSTTLGKLKKVADDMPAKVRAPRGASKR